MNKEQLLSKISVPQGHLEPTDLTPDEKKQLNDLMASNGMSGSTAYVRFFDKGFDEWELRGIDQIKREFCDRYALNNLRNTGEGFYSALAGNHGLKTALLNQMTIYGMEHRRTVEKRFDSDDWKPWERIGIRALISNFTTTI